MQSFHRLSTLYTVTFLCLSFFSIAFADTHSTSFQPDYALRITSSNIQIDCTTRLSTLVNGSSPGPTLYLKEGQTTWVRVYNDMKDENTTMVSLSNRHVSRSQLMSDSTGMALLNGPLLSPTAHLSLHNGRFQQDRSLITKSDQK